MRAPAPEGARPQPAYHRMAALPPTALIRPDCRSAHFLPRSPRAGEGEPIARRGAGYPGRPACVLGAALPSSRDAAGGAARGFLSLASAAAGFLFRLLRLGGWSPSVNLTSSLGPRRRLAASFPPRTIPTPRRALNESSPQNASRHTQSRQPASRHSSLTRYGGPADRPRRSPRRRPPPRSASETRNCEPALSLLRPFPRAARPRFHGVALLRIFLCGAASRPCPSPLRRYGCRWPMRNAAMLGRLGPSSIARIIFARPATTGGLVGVRCSVSWGRGALPLQSWRYRSRRRELLFAIARFMAVDDLDEGCCEGPPRAARRPPSAEAERVSYLRSADGEVPPDSERTPHLTGSTLGPHPGLPHRPRSNADKELMSTDLLASKHAWSAE